MNENRKTAVHVTIDGKPVSLPEVPHDASCYSLLVSGARISLDAFLESALAVRALEGAGRHIAELRVDLGGGGKLNAFGVRLEEEPGDELFSFGGVIRLVGVDLQATWLPSLDLQLTDLTFDLGKRTGSMSGAIVTQHARAEASLALGLLSENRVDASLSCAACGEAGIRVDELVSSVLPRDTTEPRSGSGAGLGAMLLRNLKNSALSSLELGVNTAKKTLRLSAEGSAFGVEGQMDFWARVDEADPAFTFSAKGACEVDLQLLPHLLQDTLGLDISADYLPRLGLGLTEIDVDQPKRHLSLAGYTTLGAHGAQLNGSLEVDLREGVKASLDLEAGPEPPTAADLVQILPFSLASAHDLIPSGTAAKLCASGLRRLSIHLDDQAQAFDLNGDCELFGSLPVSGKLQYSEAAGLSFELSSDGSTHGPAELLELVGIVPADHPGLADLLPDLELGLNEIEFSQADKKLTLSGQTKLGERAASVSFELARAADKQGGIVLDIGVKGADDHPPDLESVLTALVPPMKAALPSLPGVVNPTLEKLDLHLETGQAAAKGRLTGSFAYLGAEFEVDCKVDKEGADFDATAKGLRLSQVVEGIVGHSELPGNNLDVCLEALHLALHRTGDLKLSGEIDVEAGPSAAGPSVSLGSSELAVGKLGFSCVRTAAGEHKGLEVEIQVSGDPELQVSELFLFKGFELSYAYAQTGQHKAHWQLGGSLKVRLFDKEDFTFSASVDRDTEKSRATYELALRCLDPTLLVENFDDGTVAGLPGKTVWEALEKGGYVAKKRDVGGYDFTDKFTPYQKDFQLDLGEACKGRVPEILAYLLTTQPLISLPFVGVADDVTLAELSLACARLSYDKQGDKPAKWGFEATGDFKVYDVFDRQAPHATFIDLERGHLELQHTDKETHVAFTTETRLFNLPPIDFGGDQPLMASLGIEKIDLSRTEARGWSFESAMDAELQNLPDPLSRVFTGDIKGVLTVDQSGVAFELDDLFKDQAIDLQKLIEGQSGSFDLEPVHFKLDRFRFAFGKDISCMGALMVGLPANLNDIFGKDDEGNPRRFFRTYREGDRKSYCELDLIISLNDGVKLSLGSSPIEDIDVKGYSAKLVDDGVDGKRSLDLKFDKYGELMIQLPEFKLDLNKGSFAASGGYRIVEELKLPLTPLKLLFEQLPEVSHLADKLDGTIPITGIDIVSQEEDAQGVMHRKLLVEKLCDFMSDGGFAIPQWMQDAFGLIDRQLDNLPTRLVDYLGFHIPESLTFSISLDTEGSISFKFESEIDPLRLLIPADTTLMGIELTGIEFGTLFGTSLLKLGLSVNIDTFDLATTAASLLIPFDELPKSGLLAEIIPDRKTLQRLQNRIEIDNLIILIIYETEIPIPVPLFYDKLGLSYDGLDGSESRLAASFPMPAFSPVAAGKLLLSLIRFLTDEDCYLVYSTEGCEVHPPRGKPEQSAAELPGEMNISFRIAPLYVKLPKLLGGKLVGFEKGLPPLDAIAIAAVVLNAIKSGSFNYLVESLALDYRFFQERVQTDIFGGLNAELQFCVTTPPEFAQTVFKRLDLSHGEAGDDVLTIFPAHNIVDASATGTQESALGPENQGLIVLLDGYLDFASGSGMSILAGLSATSLSGFGTALMIKGAIAGMVDLELRGLVLIDPNGAEKLLLKGKSLLRVFNGDEIEGEFYLSNQRFHVRTHIDLFHGIEGIGLAGTIEGDVGRSGIYLHGESVLELGAFQGACQFGLSAGQVEGAPAHGDTVFVDVRLFTSDFGFRGIYADNRLSLAAWASPVNMCGGLLVISDVHQTPGRGPRALLEIADDRLEKLEINGRISAFGMLSLSTNIIYADEGFCFDITYLTNRLEDDGIYACAGLRCALEPNKGLNAHGGYDVYIDLGTLLQSLAKAVTQIIDLPYIPLVVKLETDVHVSTYDPGDIAQAALTEKRLLEEERQERRAEYDALNKQYAAEIVEIEREVDERKREVTDKVDELNLQTDALLEQIAEREKRKRARVEEVAQIEDKLDTLKGDPAVREVNASLKRFHEKVLADQHDANETIAAIKRYESNNRVGELIDQVGAYRVALVELGKDQGPIEERANKTYKELLQEMVIIVSNHFTLEHSITILQSKAKQGDAWVLSEARDDFEWQMKRVKRCISALQNGYINKLQIDGSIIHQLQALGQHADDTQKDLGSTLSDAYIDFLKDRLFTKLDRARSIYEQTLYADRPLFHEPVVPDKDHVPQLDMRVKASFSVLDFGLSLPELRFVVHDLTQRTPDEDLLTGIPKRVLETLEDNFRSLLMRQAKDFMGYVDLLYRFLSGEAVSAEIDEHDVCCDDNPALLHEIQAYNLKVKSMAAHNPLTIMHVLKHEFELCAEECARLMHQAGHTLEEIAHGLETAFDKTVDEAKKIVDWISSWF